MIPSPAPTPAAAPARARARARLLPLTVVCAAAFWLTACSSDEETPSTPAQTSPTATMSSPAASPTSAGPVDAARAVQIALDQAAGAVVVAADQSTDGGRQVWEVVLLGSDGSGSEVTIDQATGEVIRTEPEGLDPEERSAPKTTAAQAIDIALERVPGAVTDLGLGTEGGQLVWEVDVQPSSGAAQEVTINADNGSVIKQEPAD